MSDPSRPDDLQLAELLVAQGLCTRAKVDECLSFISRLAQDGVTPIPPLGELLLRKGYLTPALLQASMTARAPGSAPTEAAPPPTAAEAARDPANVFGTYVRVSRLGAGGMGEVWRTWDRVLRRWVALKFLHDDDPGQLARFRREAQTAAALNHPNVAGVYEVGQANGRPFIALQLVEGQTLETFPRGDRRRLVELLRDAALGLQHAHEKGVVHRDLKPSNLMVEGSRLFVMDFGLAKVTRGASSLSASGALLGTPAYMSPEQARADAGGATPASDVYALGATLYELLTDRPPFQADDVYALLRKVVDAEPLPPRRLRPSIDRDLETIVLKCLEKDPRRRYASARELAADFDRWLEGEAILAHPPSPAYRLRKFIGRRKAVLAIGAAGVAAVALTLGLLVPRWLRERSLQELGPLRTQVAVIREWIRQPFRKPGEIRRALGEEIDRVSAYVERHPGLPQGLYVRAQARLHLGDLPGAEEDARRALRLDPDFLPAWTLLGKVKLEEYAGLVSGETFDPFLVRGDLAAAVLREAREALRRGRVRPEIEAWGLSRTRDDVVGETVAEAMQLHAVDRRTEEALKRLDEAHRLSPSEEYCLWSARWMPPGEGQARRIREALDMAPHYAQGHLERGNLLARMQELPEAIRAYTEAIDRDPLLAAAYVSRGLAHGRRDLDAAQADFSEAIRISPRDASAFVYRAAARAQKGDPEGAIADCTKALEIDPKSVGALCNRAIARRSRKDYAGALEDLALVHRINPKFPHAWTNQAGVKQEMGDLQGAIADASRAIEANDRFWEAWSLRGILLQRAGDPDGSIADLTKVIDLLTPAKSAAALADAYGQRSQGRVLKGDLDAAVRDATEAVRLDAPRPQTHAWLGNALLLKGDAEGARREFARAIELDGKYPDAWNGRARSRLALGQRAEAAADATRALELDPSFAQARLTRALARQRGGDHAGAEADCTKALETLPAAAEAWLLRSYSRAALGRFDEAVADVDRALGLLPAAQGALARSWREAFKAGRLP